MVRHSGNKRIFKSGKSAPVDKGLRKVTFGMMDDYRSFKDFCNVRVPDNRVRFVDEAGRVEFTDNPNSYIQKEARSRGGSWS